MNPTILLSSAVVSAIVGGLITYFGQRRLAERKAQIDYESNARRRLYEAIGPLRLQLLFAARDLASRIGSHLVAESWNMNPRKYYAKSFIYRILRPLAIGTLIERQMSYADFTVDRQALDLLRFNTVVYQVMTGSEAILDHPKADWSSQSQHIFHDNLAAAAATLILDQGDSGGVVVDFARFSELIKDPTKNPAVAPLAALFGHCKNSLCENPIFWVRVVGYGYVCKHLLEVHGKGLGFAIPTFPQHQLLGGTKDPFITNRLHEFFKVFDELIARGL
jgi:hypothetical protein